MELTTLSQKEINALWLAHHSAKEKREADRIKAVYSLAIGFSVAEVAKILMIDDETVRNYWKRYKEGGIKKLIQNNYSGSESYLNDAQIDELSLHLEETTYLTIEAVIDHVEGRYGIRYSASELTQLLHRIGFVYKKAKTVPGKADAQLQKDYLKKYRRMLRNKGKNDPHYFLDGVHPQHNTMPIYGWVKKGKDKLIKANTGRERVNINGALNAEKMEVVARMDEAINAQSTIKLFKQLEAKHRRAKRIYITLDNAGYYRSDVVTKYLKTLKIRLMFLPPYSPNLNLIERLWKFMKKTVLYNKYYEKFSNFKDAIQKFFENLRLKLYNEKLRSLITQNFQIIDDNKLK